MKIEIPNSGMMYQNENSSDNRNISLEDDSEVLQIKISNETDKKEAVMSLSKSQMLQLRDALNLFIKNKLIE